MKSAPFHILRVGIAITFLWIGVLILKDPIGWGGYVKPFFENLLPISLNLVMILNGIFDILIGILLLMDYFTFGAAFLGTLHLILVLIVSGINEITIRDVGLLAATIALMLTTWPQKFQFLKK